MMQKAHGLLIPLKLDKWTGKCHQRLATAAMFLRSLKICCLGASIQRWAPPFGAGYTFRRNIMKTAKFDFEKKAISCFLVSYRLNNITVSCLLECGVMTWAQSDLYGETLSFFLFNNLLKTLHHPF